MTFSRGTLLLVGAGLLQVPAVETAHRLGLRVVATDQNPQAPALKLADEAVVLSTKDVDGHIELARALARRCWLRGVYTEGAECAYTVARVAEALGLPGTNPLAAWRCDHKAEMRRLFAAAGMPGPRFREVCTVAEAYAAFEEIGPPVIIKPIDSNGSKGTKRIDRAEDLPQAFAVAQSFSTTRTALIEEYLEGPELSVDTIVYRGRHYRGGICDRHFSYLPYLIETGHTNPTRVSEAVQEEIYRRTAWAAEIVGIDFGVAKCDFKLTEQYGPTILEMTNRLSGGFDCQYTKPLATGLDLIKATIDLAIGEELDEADLTPKWQRVAASTSPFPPPGKIVEISGISEARRLPGVKHIFMLVRPGDVVEPYIHCVTRVGFVIAAGDTYEQVNETLDRALRTIRITTVAVN